MLVAGVLVLLVAAGALTFLDTDGTGEATNATDWREVPLEDVSTGETFTVAELEKPVLVETFAVWCPTCTRQQKEVQELHRQSGITSVSLDTDPNEDAAKIRQHLNRHGFDWRYAVAPSELTRSLVREHGRVMVNPPSAPMVLVCENGTRKLPTGVKPASKLQEEVEKGC